jgi:hypothetical protein
MRGQASTVALPTASDSIASVGIAAALKTAIGGLRPIKLPLTSGVSEFRRPQSGVSNVAHKMRGWRLAWDLDDAQ